MVRTPRWRPNTIQWSTSGRKQNTCAACVLLYFHKPLLICYLDRSQIRPLLLAKESFPPCSTVNTYTGIIMFLAWKASFYESQLQQPLGCRCWYFSKKKDGFFQQQCFPVRCDFPRLASFVRTSSLGEKKKKTPKKTNKAFMWPSDFSSRNWGLNLPNQPNFDPIVIFFIRTL